VGVAVVRVRGVVYVLAVLFTAAVSVVQWVVTSPGVVTDLEFRMLLLAAGPALTAVAFARWVDAAERPFDARGGDGDA
jgi:hypothetical protein